MAPLLLLQKECGPKCKSRKHVEEIISVITKCSLVEFKAFSFLCHNWYQHSDTLGRTALHVAVSCGKLDILRWLLEESKTDLNAKDLESGYTALHRALFYGQLSAARLLIQHHSDIHILDSEGLNPLDVAVLSRPPNVKYSLCEPNEVYTWGENHNNVLGHASSNRKAHPEVMDVFRKRGITIKQMVLCKYHSVFLSHAGQVYTCGHGQGGRLGHGNQETLLVPKLLETVQNETCLEVAAATDHTLLRMEGGVLYTFGINSSHQLGQTPFVESSLHPKLVNVKPLKGRTITGVCVGRFHSVVCTSDSLYTVGLNAGQLGHLKGDKYVSQLKLVSSLRHTDIGIAKVACSDAATVCLTTKGDVLVLHEYQCRKILSRKDFEQVLVTGGHLDHSTGMGVLNEKGGSDLCVHMRDDGGQISVWHSSRPTLKLCQFSSKRQLRVSDMAVTNVNLLMITDSGEAFLGTPHGAKSSASDDCQKEMIREREVSHSIKVQKMAKLDEIEEFNVKRLLGIHRAVGVAADRKGRNFAVIQALPNGCLSEIPSVSNSQMNDNFKQLLLDAEACDPVHDALIQIEDKVWPVHCYIVALRSDYCRSAVAKSHPSKNKEKLKIKVTGVSQKEMDQIVQYIYTDTCDYLTIGHKLQQEKKKEQYPGGKTQESTMEQEMDGIDRSMSAFQVEQKRKEMKRENNKTKAAAAAAAAATQNGHQNPIKSLQDAARKLGVKGLSKRLDAVKCVDGVVVSTDKCLVKPKVKFDRTKLPELYDITIATEDGKKLQCHKCVLICRLEYFHSMLAMGWVESAHTSSLTLPVGGDVLEILIDFLYTDEALPLRDCTNEELLCNVLVVADQLLAWRLKEMCEVALTNIITLKSVSELLEFASLYNAEQLKLACQEFVCLNITALLEARGLEVCSDDTMQELTGHYRATNRQIRYRVMSVADKGPSQDYLDELVAEYESFDSADSQYLHDPSKKGRQAKRRSSSKRSKSISEDVPKIGIGPSGELEPNNNQVSGRVENCRTNSESELLVAVQDLNQEMAGEEKKMKAITAKLDKTRWRPLNMVEGSCPIVPTQPEDVPLWSPSLKPLSWGSRTTAHSASTHGDNAGDPYDPRLTDAGTSCPTSPSSPPALATSPTSLRDIIMEESQAEPIRKSSLSSRFSWKDAKKRQARESQDRLQRQHSGDGKESCDAKPVPPRVPAKAWGAVGSVVSSFRDLVLQEENQKPAGKPQTHQLTNGQGVGMATAASGTHRGTFPGSSPIPCPARSPIGENPWQRRAEMAASPPTEPIARAIDFSAIVQDEMQQMETLAKIRQKPLALIQLEEQAMLELLHHYKASSRTDVTITVERVSKAMATPLWHHERDQVGSL